MITKMDKYSFVLFHSDLAPFLAKVQELGMVDITREHKAVDSISSGLFSLGKRYVKAIKDLEIHKASLSSEEYDNIIVAQEIKEKEPENLLEYTEEAILRRDQLKLDFEQLKKDYNDSRQWGPLQKEEIEKIEKLGYNLHLYSVSEKGYKSEWENDYIIHILNRDNGKIFFALLNHKDNESKFELTESKRPQKSCDFLEQQIEINKAATEENNNILNQLTKEISRLQEAMNSNKEQLDLYLAGVSSIKEAEGTLALLTGFVPADNRESIVSFLNKQGVYYITEKAAAEDNPPVKLKNGFFAQLYEPIGELYMLPKYGELDLTPFFAPFYMFFFGFCLGDMGYGLVILIAATIAKFKLPKFKSYLTLAQFLGVGAIVMAALSGVFFGTRIQEIIPMPESVQALFFSDLKMFWFAIIFGLIQIVFARMVNAIDSMIRKGWQYGMHNIGWSVGIIWAAWYYATTMSPEITMPAFMNYAALAGVALILFFTSNSGNIFVRVAKGTIAFYDITSIFGDMLSYIRLFGLGTSGAILGMVVNSVAMSLTGIPYIGWVFAALMLVFGHLMVLMLASLGAFVHPMRLTFVEFYKNASFSGGGRAFRPLGKEAK